MPPLRAAVKSDLRAARPADPARGRVAFCAAVFVGVFALIGARMVQIALFDGGGRVVGINAQIYSQSGGNIGIGFAIPATEARSEGVV